MLRLRLSDAPQWGGCERRRRHARAYGDVGIFERKETNPSPEVASKARFVGVASGNDAAPLLRRNARRALLLEARTLLLGARALLLGARALLEPLLREALTLLLEARALLLGALQASEDVRSQVGSDAGVAQVLAEAALV